MFKDVMTNTMQCCISDITTAVRDGEGACGVMVCDERIGSDDDRRE
jgi:hypothetical protein